MWTYTNLERGSGVVRRAGVNFGAPGSRLCDAGTWWVEYPFIGESDDRDWLQMGAMLPIESNGEEAPTVFRHDSSWVADAAEGANWISASGLEGPVSLVLDLSSADEEEELPEGLTYTVRLHFVEPGTAEPGQRQFSVALQGREVITGLDIAREAGGERRAVVHEVTGVEVTDELTIELVSANNSQYEPVLCGVELVLEDDAVAAAPHNGADVTHSWAGVAPTWTERILSVLAALPFATSLH